MIRKKNIIPMLFSLMAKIETQGETLSDNDFCMFTIQKRIMKPSWGLPAEIVPTDFPSDCEEYRITLTIERRDI